MPVADSSEPVSRPRLAASMARRRANILRSAVSLFQERGYLGTTVDDIAERAGVTKRTLYHHMGDKENILVEIHSNVVDEGLRRWEEAVAAGGSTVDVLCRLLERHVEMGTEYREDLTVFFEEGKHVSAERRGDIALRRDRYEAILRGVIADGVASGELRSGVDAAFAARLFLGGLNEMYRWYRPESPGARDVVAATVRNLVLDGLGAPTAV